MKLLTLLLLFSATALCQTITISVHHLDKGYATLSSLEGEKLTFVDSIQQHANGTFAFSIKPENTHTGFYRLSLGKNAWIDFLNDGKDVSISTDASAIAESLHVVASEGNRLFYSFIKNNKEYKTKSELLQLVLSRYPKSDPYYVTTQTTAATLQRAYSDFIESASKGKSRSFIARYIRSGQPAIVNFTQPPDKQLAYLKAHALDNVDFLDADLIHSDAFTSKSIEYLMYYRNPQLPKELLEKEFMVAIDTILNKARGNHEVYQHIVEYLIDGFKKFGFDQPIDYIVENYVIKDDICLDVKTEGLIKRRIGQAKNFKIGNVVPNIVLPDTFGAEVGLSQMTADKVLIVFYASTCPHCRKMLPQLSELYRGQKEKKVEVIAVSMDENKTDWLNFVKENNLSWINLSDLKGWNGKAVLDYSIYATPTMFLIGRTMKIISKPMGIEEVRSLF